MCSKHHIHCWKMISHTKWSLYQRMKKFICIDPIIPCWGDMSITRATFSVTLMLSINNHCQPNHPCNTTKHGSPFIQYLHFPSRHQIINSNSITKSYIDTDERYCQSMVYLVVVTNDDERDTRCATSSNRFSIRKSRHPIVSTDSQFIISTGMRQNCTACLT